MNILACTTHAIWWEESANLECPACMLERELAQAKMFMSAMRTENTKLKDEIKGLRGFRRSVDEALNSGDGVYRP